MRQSMAWADPLYRCRTLLIEVWHDSGLSQQEHDVAQCEFLGEVEYSMNLTPKEPARQRIRLPLAANREKAKRQVQGWLTFEYRWQPLPMGDPDLLLVGQLEVIVVRAEKLLNMDWKGSHLSDAYCMVVTHPTSAGKDGIVRRVSKRTRTLWDAVSPNWSETMSFDVCWYKVDMDKDSLKSEMKSLTRQLTRHLSGSSRLRTTDTQEVARTHRRRRSKCGRQMRRLMFFTGPCLDSKRKSRA